LFLFVIMLLGAEITRPKDVLPWQRPVSYGLAIILIVEAVYVIFFRQVGAPGYPAVPSDFGSAGSIGMILFNEYILPFEITSILLLVAMIGAIVLSQLAGKSRRVRSNPEQGS